MSDQQRDQPRRRISVKPSRNGPRHGICFSIFQEAPGKEVGHAEATRRNRNHRSIIHQLLLDYQLLRRRLLQQVRMRSLLLQLLRVRLRGSRLATGRARSPGSA